MAQRSIYITVVGWIFIILSGITLLESLFFVFMPAEKFLAAAQQSGQAAGPQPSPAMMGSFLHGMGYFMLILSLWVLGSSIGLILRKAWARISFIIILGIGIFFDSLYLLFAILGASMASKTQGSDGMVAFGQAVMVFMIVFCAAFLAFYIWTLIVLNTEKVKAEFEPKPKQPVPVNP